MEIPRRITQSWIERTVPTLTAADFARLLDVMRQRKWTEADLAARVYPIRDMVDETTNPAPGDHRTQETRVQVHCPRSHAVAVEVPEGGAERTLRCPTCHAGFLALVNVECLAVDREPIARTFAYHRFVTSSQRRRASGTVRIRYRAPTPPPIEARVEFTTRGTAQHLQLRSGDRISITFKKQAMTRGRRPQIITNHALARSWRVRSDGLAEKAFDHLEALQRRS